MLLLRRIRNRVKEKKMDSLSQLETSIMEKGSFTDESIAKLESYMLSSDIKGYSDETFLRFISFVNRMPYDSRVQDIIKKVVDKLSEKGIISPCMGGCSDACAFHEMEFGK